MAASSSSCSSKRTTTASSASEFTRSSTLQKLELLTAAGKCCGAAQKKSQHRSANDPNGELLRILGRQRVRVDKNAIHFVSEPAQRRESVIKSTPPKVKTEGARYDPVPKRKTGEQAQGVEKHQDEGESSLSRKESIFRMAPAAAGRTIIARVGAPRADWLSLKTLKGNSVLLRRFTIESSDGSSEHEQEDSGREEDAAGAGRPVGVEEEETATRECFTGDVFAATADKAGELAARKEHKEQLLTSVAAALQAEIEETLKEGKEAVVTTEPYNVDEPADITLAVTKIQDMAAEVERLKARDTSVKPRFSQTFQSTDASVTDLTTAEQVSNNKSEIVLTEADFNVLESLQQAYIRANLIVWLDHMKTIYTHGVRLLRVNVLGCMFIRIVTIRDGCIQLVPANAKAKSRRTVALTLIETVTLGKYSREFRALKERITAGDEVAEADPPATTCAVLVLPKNRTVSLLFMDELQRNGFVFAVRVWSMWAKAALRELEWEA